MAGITTLAQKLIETLHKVKIPSLVDNEFVLNLTQAHATISHLSDLLKPYEVEHNAKSIIETVAFRFVYGLWILEGIKLCYLLDTYRHYKHWEVPSDYYVAPPNESDVDTMHYENISKLVYSIRFGRYFVRLLETIIPRLPNCTSDTVLSEEQRLECYLVLYGFHDCVLYAVTVLHKLLLQLLLVKNKTYTQLQDWLTSNADSMLLNKHGILLTDMEESVVHINNVLLEVPIELYEANKNLFAERLL